MRWLQGSRKADIHAMVSILTAEPWIPAAPEVRPGLKLRLSETGIEGWTVNQTFTTCP